MLLRLLIVQALCTLLAVHVIICPFYFLILVFLFHTMIDLFLWYFLKQNCTETVHFFLKRWKKSSLGQNQTSHERRIPRYITRNGEMAKIRSNKESVIVKDNGCP